MADESKPISEMRSVLAKAVKERRLRFGLTQEELGWRAGLHRTYITDIERGARNLSLLSIERLAGALQASVAELLTDSQGGAKPGGGRSGGDDAGVNVDILLVEDNPDDVELTLQAFRAARVWNQIQVVHDGVEAMEFLFCQGKYVRPWPSQRALVMLLDLSLPRLDGLEVLRRVRSDARTLKLPVIVLTDSGRGRDMAECRRLGCSHYLTKPVGFDKFCRITSDLRFDWKLFRRPQTFVHPAPAKVT